MINESLYSCNSVEWETPQNLFDQLNNEFHFTIDVCATSENAKCKRYYTKNENGLIQDWQNEIVWCNPPYGREINKWVEKAFNESAKGCVVVLLIPARTDTKYFHNFIYNIHEVRFIKGRLHFNNSDQPAPFPSMIVIMKQKGVKL